MTAAFVSYTHLTNLQDTPDVTRELYKDLPPQLITMFQRSYNWMLEHMEQINLHHKVIAETYINAWFFMHNHLEYLPADSHYLVIDKYPETLLTVSYTHLSPQNQPASKSQKAKQQIFPDIEPGNLLSLHSNEQINTKFPAPFIQHKLHHIVD